MTITTSRGSIAAVTGEALGTRLRVAVTDPRVLAAANAGLVEFLAQVDATYSRFRPDSELSLVEPGRPRPHRVSPLLRDAIAASLRAAALTDGCVDPTVGPSLIALGYDRDIGEVRRRPAATDRPVVPAAGWWRVDLDRSASTVRLPAGVTLDLGATGKAFAADRAASTIAQRLDVGILVDLGGDIATAGPPPAGGWRIRVTEVPDDRDGAAADETISVAGGGVATSSVLLRRWSRGTTVAHHIVNPRTGEPVDVVWRTVTVAAGTCVDANTASTAAVVMGAAAPRWLSDRGLPARLVGADGIVLRTARWPKERS